MSRSASLGRMNRYALVLPVLVLVGCAAALTGCTAAPPPPPAPTVTVTPNPVAAQLTCDQFSTLVETPIHNAQTGPATADLPEEYVAGMYRIAARALPVIQVEPGTDLEKAIEGAQALVTNADTLEFPGFDPNSTEWQAAREAVLDACADEGVEMFAEGWIGG